MTRKEVLKKQQTCEENGQFDVHTDPIDYDNCWPVDEHFHYLKKGIKEKTITFLRNQFIVKPFTKKQNKEMGTVVFGKENLKNIKNAVVVSNHINKFDCLVQKYAMSGKKLFITAADFNNQKGKFGDYMRAGGLMPFSKNFTAMKNMDKAIAYHLTHNHYVLFYPEQAMWWNYEKPRPFKNGAFHFAVKNNVPVIPSFITMKNNGKFDEEGIPCKQFSVHIMPAIYPNPTLTKEENIEYLKTTAYSMFVKKYEEIYQKQLTFNISKKKSA